MSAKIEPNFADRECRVVSETDQTAVILDFLDPEQLLFLSSSSSVILTRLSGPRSRPTFPQLVEMEKVKTDSSCIDTCMVVNIIH
jgi:hypothetical protein